MAKNQIGGSFAPPLDDAKIAAYEALTNAAGDEIKDAMTRLLNCVKRWWELPESGGAGSKHASGAGVVVSLDDSIAKDLWEHIPWTRELSAMAELFESIDASSQRDLRNAAFHLLWFTRELDLDREPITSDKL